MSTDKILRCSFCNKAQQAVLKLIAGPRDTYICDECIGICNGILAEDKIFPDHPALNPGTRRYDVANEHLPGILTLIGAGEYKSAARLIRNAALIVMDGLLEFAGESRRRFVHEARMAAIADPIGLLGHDRHGAYEVGVANAVLYFYPNAQHALQEVDNSHVILRMSIDGATVSAEDANGALEGLRLLLLSLKDRIDQALTEVRDAASRKTGA